MYKSFWLAFRENNEKQNKGTCGKKFLKSGPIESKLTVNFGKKANRRAINMFSSVKVHQSNVASCTYFALFF